MCAFLKIGSLFIELRSQDQQDEGNNYHELAKMFLIHHYHVNIVGLKDSKQPRYSISNEEVIQIQNIISTYLLEK